MTTDDKHLPPDIPRKPLSLAVKVAIAAAVVLAILGVGLAAALVNGNMSSIHAEAQMLAARMHVRQIHSSVQHYKMTKGRLPDDLMSLVERDEKGNSSLTELTQDPWYNGYKIVIESPTKWKVISFGPDGLEGTEDDISSADEER